MQAISMSNIKYGDFLLSSYSKRLITLSSSLMSTSESIDNLSQAQSSYFAVTEK